MRCEIDSRGFIICNYRLPREVKVFVHGDDFVAVGGRKEVHNFKQHLATRFTVKKRSLDLEEERVSYKRHTC